MAKAGRPKGTPNKRRADFVQALKANGNMETLIAKLMELSLGVTVQEYSKDGPKIYKKPPCVTSITYMLDQAFGKAKQALEIAGEDGQAIKLTIDLRE